MTMAVKGVFASDQNIDGTRAGDFASGILQVFPTGTAPLFALTAGMESKDARDTTVTWFEENKITGRSGITTGIADTTTTTGLVATDASSYVVGSILLVEETGEYLFVTAVSGNNLTVTRGFAGSTAANITTSHNLQELGKSFEEGSDRPTAVANIGLPRFNYVQIFRNTWDVTLTAQAVDYRTGDLRAKNERDCAFFHAEDIEKGIIFGRRSIGIRNNRPFRTMDGINTQITTNVTAAGATTSYAQLDTFFKDVFAKNIRGKPNERIAFTGNLGLSVLNNVALIHANTSMNLTPGQTEFGMNVHTWITPYGTVKLMTHPLMVESPFWTGDLNIYHPGAIRTRYLRRTTIDNDDASGTRAGRDANSGVYTTEMCVEYMAEATGGRLTGIQDAA